MSRTSKALHGALRQIFQRLEPTSMQYRNQGVAVNEFVGSHTNLARMFSSSLQKSAMFSFRGQRRYPRPTELRFQPSTFTYSWYQNFRRFTSDSNMVLWSLIGANGAVFLLWRARPEFAARHTVVSLDALRHGRYWTLITSGFSQADIMHLGSNMISLYFFGKDIGRLFGGKKLLGLYLSGAIAGSMAHVLWTWHRERQLYGSHRIRWGFGPGSSGALGASAAVNAIVLMDVLLFPTRTILLYGIIPMPAALLGLLWLWNDLGGVVSGVGTGTAHAGHLGGACTGLAFYLAFRRGRFRPKGWW